MKLIILAVVASVLVSCGGSKSDSNNPNARMLTPLKPNGPRTVVSNITDAKELLQQNTSTFENIIPGTTFDRFQVCNYKSSTYGDVDGRLQQRLTVLSYNKETREIIYKVTVVEAPSDESCNGTDIPDKEYVLHENLPTLESATYFLDQINDLKITTTNFNREQYMIFNGTYPSDDGDILNVEVGINMAKSFILGSYMELKGVISNYDMDIYSASFVVELVNIDPASIDLSNLPVYSEDSDINFL
jgi:hypothetical protein